MGDNTLEFLNNVLGLVLVLGCLWIITSCLAEISPDREKVVKVLDE